MDNNKNKQNAMNSAYGSTRRMSAVNITNEDREGVVYTPSRDKRPPEQGIKRRPPARRGMTVKNGSKKKPPQKSQYAVFFVCVMLFGAIACIITFAMMFNSLVPPSETKHTEKPKPAFSQEPEQPADTGAQKNSVLTALVTGNDTNSKKLDLYDFETQMSYSVYTDSNTEMKDRYGSAVTFAEFKPGEIVDVTYAQTTGIAKLLRMSVNAKRHDSVTGAVVDTEALSVTIAGNVYGYDEQTEVLYKNQAFDIADIDAIDVVTAVGYGSHLTSLTVLKSHGTVTMSAISDVINGVIEIDTNIIAQIDKNVSEKVAEGEHRVVVKGSNIEPFITEFSVARGETCNLTIGELKYNAGYLTVDCSEPGIKLTINGAAKKPGEKILLPFGELTIVAAKDGFMTVEEKLDFKLPAQEYTIYVEKIATTQKLTVNTDPQGADIYIDNVYKGVSPLTLEVAYGQVNLSIRKEGYANLDFPVTVRAEDPPLLANVTLTAVSN